MDAKVSAFVPEAARNASVSAGLRWTQLIMGVVCMAMIANLQYGWTLFVNPIIAKYQFNKADLQWAFTIFVLLETWLVPAKGYLVDKFGPRLLMIAGGILVGAAWTLNAYATTLNEFYLAAVIGGLGAGAVYCTCVGQALKWFPDKRGLAAGLTAMGFGAGSALTVIPIANTIATQGYETAFLTFGIIQGVVVFILGFFFRKADSRAIEAKYPAPVERVTSLRQVPPMDVVKTPVFWLMYIMFVMMAAGGLMAVAQLGPIAADFKIANVPVTLGGITLAALPFALTIDRVLNGVSRPLFGWISDRIGRENTMFFAFLIEGLGIVALGVYGQDPVLFVILSGLVFFAWGEIYSLFPATAGDTYGSKFASSNAGLLYTAKGTASLLVPYSSILAAQQGWQAVLYVAAALNILAAFMALLILKPLRRRYVQRQSQGFTASANVNVFPS